MPKYKLKHCVWETTLRCNLNCRHCGSRAGQARGEELTTDEAVKMFGQLAELGCERVIMSGGEPLLRPDILQLAQEIKKCGMKACMISNGMAIPDKIKLVEEMDLYSIAISLDGLETTHNFLRAHPKSFDHVMQSLNLLKSFSADVYVVTQLNKYNFVELSALHELILTSGVKGWQIQLTSDMGRAEELQDFMISIEQIRELMDFVLVNKRGAVPIYSGDDIGYYYKDSFCFHGCGGGISVIGIEADGTIKPCLSMQKDRRFDGGNLRQRSLSEIWNDPDFAAINRRPRKLKGKCTNCQHSKKCRGGCVGTSLAFDSVDEFPFCARVSD